MHGLDSCPHCTPLAHTHWARTVPDAGPLSPAPPVLVVPQRILLLLLLHARLRRRLLLLLLLLRLLLALLLLRLLPTLFLAASGVVQLRFVPDLHRLVIGALGFLQVAASVCVRV